MKKGDPCPCGKCRFWAYEKTASGLRARWRTKAAYEKLAASNVRRQHAKRHEVRGLTTIRPDTLGYFPQLGPGQYSVALGNGSQFEVVVFGELGGRDHQIELRHQHRNWTFRMGFDYKKLVGIRPFEVGDAFNFSDFLTDQFSLSRLSIRRKGSYHPSFCAHPTA